MTTTIMRIVTVHADASLRVQLELLDAVEEVLQREGVARVWIDPECHEDLVVLAEVETRDPVAPEALLATDDG